MEAGKNVKEEGKENNLLDSDNNLDVQEFMILPIGADSITGRKFLLVCRSLSSFEKNIKEPWTVCGSGR